MTLVRVAAPAKVNLTLHVRGQREDGFHSLDSLVVFAPVHDLLKIESASEHCLSVTGRFQAGVPTDDTNLVLRAARLLSPNQGLAVTLDKRLPPASGLGGGSADAAALGRALALDGKRTSLSILTTLGSDIPMCLTSAPVRAQGRGEVLTPLNLPPLPAVLVNPRIPVSTAEVFAALDCHDNPPMPETLPPLEDLGAVIRFLATCRNDLEAPARALAPPIGAVLEALAACDGCAFARMSGSGATCFGLFPDTQFARRAARILSQDRPDWWIETGALGDQSHLARPLRGPEISPDGL